MGSTAELNANPDILELRLLGPLEVWQNGDRQKLPRSKKTRALLAYLAMSGREHSRNRLCDLFWDVTDDRRGALRWSLSRLRKVVDGNELRRIEADRERVSFVAHGARIDALELCQLATRGVASADTETLESLASKARGEFLEGLELPDFFEFQAWCVQWRERSIEARSQVLEELVRRTRDDPMTALGHARSRVQADSLNVSATVDLLELLIQAGKPEEARKQLEMSCRLFREVGADGAHAIESAWRSMSTASMDSSEPEPVVAAQAPAPRPAPVASTKVSSTKSERPFIGRRAEIERLGALLLESRERGTQRVALVTGEPGAGKSRLAELLVSQAHEQGFAVLSSRAYEAESSRPYGPWVDALGKDLGELLPAEADQRSPSRDALFSTIADTAATTAAQHNGALLLLDDVQWLDRDSAELLHFVARTNLQRPVFLVLFARSGELADNEHALRALRSLRRETTIEETVLEPLSREEVDELVAHYDGIDAAQIYDACAGNPMYALELARASSGGRNAPPASLLELVRERIEQLPTHAADILRWCAVLGHTVDINRLQSLSSLDDDQLLDAVERLEQHEILRAQHDNARIRYVFAHDVVRQAVYGELSHPRRLLMHKQVARLLEEAAQDSEVAKEVAHHASLAGDAMLGVRACIAAGRQSLRMFANGDAEALAKRGLRLVDELPGTERTASTLELLHVQYSARTPDGEQAAARLRELTEEALDAGLTTPARLGFQMLSFLRWESGSMAAAHDNIMRAERLSRSADPAERTTALSQAAKCLVLLERNMALAESFLLESDALSSRAGVTPSALRFAAGMMCEHRGELDEAEAAFVEARQLGRQQGDRLAEFCAIEHLMMLELDRRNYQRALELADALTDLGERVRAGAEAACSRALRALAVRVSGAEADDSSLDDAIEELRAADSKYRLAWLLTRLAQLELDAGASERAASLASDALSVATDIRRASEMTLARALLAQCAGQAGDAATTQRHLAALDELRDRELSRAARAMLDSTLEELAEAAK